MSDMTPSKWHTSAPWLLVLPIAILIVLAVGSMTLVSREMANARDAHSQVLRTREVLAELQTVMSRLQDAESSERAYIITDDERLLGPLESAERAVAQHLSRLKSLLPPEADRAEV